jgi:hypothetical protein
MKKLTLLLSAIISLSSVAQEKKLAIGINFSPDYSYRALNYRSGDRSYARYIAERNGDEYGKLGFTTGINAAYFFKENLALEAGIQYANKGYKSTWGMPVIMTPKEPYISGGKELYKYNFIDIPLKLNYFIGSKKVRAVAGVGIVPSIFLSSKYKTISYYTNGDKEIRKLNGPYHNYNPINVGAIASIGADIALSEVLHLRIEPTFRYQFVNLYRDYDIKEHLWSAGLNFGMYYHL